MFPWQVRAPSLTVQYLENFNEFKDFIKEDMKTLCSLHCMGVYIPNFFGFQPILYSTIYLHLFYAYNTISNISILSLSSTTLYSLNVNRQIIMIPDIFTTAFTNTSSIIPIRYTQKHKMVGILLVI